MNKTEQLTQQAAEVLKAATTQPDRYSVEIFYGDCSCEYTQQRNAHSIGWHLEIQGGHDQDHAEYLGKNYKIAASRLPSAIKRTVKGWEESA